MGASCFILSGPTALFAPLAELFVRVLEFASLSALLTSTFRAEADKGSVGMDGAVSHGTLRSCMDTLSG